jgi:uncharacterized SAM-binding protein YcdF (DUF218 family)
MNPNLPAAGLKRRISCLQWLGGMAGLLFALLLGSIILYAFLFGLGAYLIVADPLKPSSALVILSGDLGRMEETARLYKDDFGRWLIITETSQPSLNPEYETKTTMVKRLEAIREGIPEDSILITKGKSSSTLDEANAVKSLLEGKNMTSAIIVTDPFHSRRTRTIFRDVLNGSGIDIIIRPVRNHWYRSDSWFYSKLGWITTVQEYGKYFAYLAGIRGD